MTAILETSPKLFVHHMNAMRMHYKKNPDVAYALPLRLTKATLKVASTGSSEPVVDQGEQEVNAACIAWKEDTLAWNKAQENSVNAGVDALRATSDTRSFEEDMNKKREQSKQQMNDSIDRYYDRLIETGKQYPATQGLILSTCNEVCTFLANVLAAFGEFVGEIVDQIMAWIKAAVEWAEQTAKNIANWFMSSASNIETCFPVVLTALA